MKKLSKSRERLQAVRSKLSNLTEGEKQKLQQTGTVVTVDGRHLSGNNVMLILLQMPGATVVGGFNQWKQSGRQVKKGSSGLSIWVPTSKKTEDGEETKYFIAGSVFDVSQTEPIMETVEA